MINAINNKGEIAGALVLDDIVAVGGIIVIGGIVYLANGRDIDAAVSAVKGGVTAAVEAVRELFGDSEPFGNAVDSLLNGNKDVKTKSAGELVEMAGATMGDPSNFDNNDNKQNDNDNKNQEEAKANETAKNSDNQTNAKKRLTDAEVEQVAKDSTHNPNSDKVMLGKFEGENVPTSYQNVAGKTHSYFEMTPAQWNTYSSSDKLRINDAFLRQQIEQGKEIYTSHRPLNQTASFSRELQSLKAKYGIVEYERVGGIWKAIK